MEYQQLSEDELQALVNQNPPDIPRRLRAKAELDRRILDKAQKRKGESWVVAGVFLAFLTLIAATLVVPEVRRFIGLDRPETDSSPGTTGKAPSKIDNEQTQEKSDLVAKRAVIPRKQPKTPVNSTPTIIASAPRVPTTEELADAVALKLQSDALAAKAKPIEVLTAPCRGDALNLCTDPDLVEWGKPLLENMNRISQKHGRETDAARELKGDKRITDSEAAGKSALDTFRECCAEDALKFYKELSSRVGGGTQKNSYSEWMRNLTQPVGSSEWKSARNYVEGYNIALVYLELKWLSSQLDHNRKIRNLNLPR